ncbi:hypothetical protein BX070DRAFT_226538 [Coemansia spiralis]|nr:hypothetical protein BX070DRAFT_226538 [Coemansia spiralis]
MSTMKFGPEWMRNAPSQNKSTSSNGNTGIDSAAAVGSGEKLFDSGAFGEPGHYPNNLLASAASTVASGSLKYSYERMLELFKPQDTIANFIANEIVFSSEALAPVCMTEMSEREQEILAGSINSGSAKRYNSTSSHQQQNQNQQQPGRQQTSLHFHSRNGNVHRHNSQGVHSTSRSKLRDGITRSASGRANGTASEFVIGEELAFGGNTQFLGDQEIDTGDASLWADQSIARSSVGTFGADGIFRMSGDDGDLLESQPVQGSAGSGSINNRPDTSGTANDSGRNGSNSSSTQANLSGNVARKDNASAAGGNLAWSSMGGGTTATGQQQQPPPSLLQERQLIERADQIKWWYRDPQGELQGPFSTSHMQEWYSGGYFPTDLQVCHEGGAGFQLLSAMVSSAGNYQSPFLLAALAFMSRGRSPISGLSTPATPKTMSRAASSLHMLSLDSDPASGRASAAPTASTALMSESLLLSSQAGSHAADQAGLNKQPPVGGSFADPLKRPQDGASTNEAASNGVTSQAMQLTILLNEQYAIVGSIGERQHVIMRLQEQLQQSLAKLMQELSQESNAIHYRAQIDRMPVQPELLFALQQRAHAAEEKLRHEYAQLVQTQAAQIAQLEANVDPVIKDIVLRNGPAYALTFIGQRLQELSVQIANEDTAKQESISKNQEDIKGATDASATAQDAAKVGDKAEYTVSANSDIQQTKAEALTADSESTNAAANVQEKMDQLSVSDRASEKAKGSTAKNIKERVQPKPTLPTTIPKTENPTAAADNDLTSAVESGSEQAPDKEKATIVGSSGEAATQSASTKEKTANISYAGPAAPWSTSASSKSKKPKKTLLQIQQEEEAQKKRQQSEEKRRSQAAALGGVSPSGNSISTSYAGRLGNASTSNTNIVGLSTGTSPSAASSTYSLAAIMAEQSKEISVKRPAGSSISATSASSPLQPAAPTTSATASASSNAVPRTAWSLLASQKTPASSWGNTGALSSASTAPAASAAASANVGVVGANENKNNTSNSTVTTAAKQQPSKSATATKASGSQQSQCSALPSMEFLEWCYSRLGSLRGIDICKFIEVLLTFPHQMSESTIEIISEQIYAYSPSLNGRAFAEDFAKRRRKDHGAVANGSVKSAPANWTHILTSSKLAASNGPLSTSTRSTGSSGAHFSAARNADTDNSFQTIKKKGRK